VSAVAGEAERHADRARHEENSDRAGDNDGSATLCGAACLDGIHEIRQRWWGGAAALECFTE
jgi:hypothetical protein